MSLRAVTAATIAVLVGMLGALSSASPPAAAAASASPAALPAAAGRTARFEPPRLPQRLRRGGPIGAGKLKRKLRNLARQAPGASGYYVFDLDAKGNRVLFDRSGGHSRKLASNEKLFTTMTAMHRLGPNSRIVTKVKARGKVGRPGKARRRPLPGRRRRPDVRLQGRRVAGQAGSQGGHPQGQGDRDRRRQRLRPTARGARHQLRRRRRHRAAQRPDLRRVDLRRGSAKEATRRFRDALRHAASRSAAR